MKRPGSQKENISARYIGRQILYPLFALLAVLIAAAACNLSAATEPTSEATLAPEPAASPTGVIPVQPEAPTPTEEAAPTNLPTSTKPPPAAQTATPFPAIASITWIDEATGWAATHETGKVLKTSDGGMTWQDITHGNLFAGILFALDDRAAWAAEGFRGPSSDPGSRYRTQDGGQTWNALGLPVGVDTIHFLDGDNGWATGSEMGCGAGSCFIELYRTADGGLTWEPLQPASPYGEQDEHPNTVRIRTGQSFEFSDPDTIWLAGSIWWNQEHGCNALLWVSRDAGSTWQELRVPMPEAAPGHAIPDYVSHPVFLNDEEAYFTAGYTTDETDGSQSSYLAFFYSTDGGKTWTARQALIRTPPYRGIVEFVSSEVIFALCLEGMCASRDGALSWEVIATGLPFEPEELAALDFASPSVGWALVWNAEGGSDLYKTSDGGRTWQLIPAAVRDRR
jgi:photosystem II stability/assembly factor-like uncharacterized protein